MFHHKYLCLRNTPAIIDGLIVVISTCLSHVIMPYEKLDRPSTVSTQYSYILESKFTVYYIVDVIIIYDTDTYKYEINEYRYTNQINES